MLGSSAISEVIAEIRSLTSKPFTISLGRTAQRQRAHRNVAAAGVGRGGPVAEKRWGTRRDGVFRRTLSARTF
jgi:hypothetical protein